MYAQALFWPKASHPASAHVLAPELRFVLRARRAISSSLVRLWPNLDALSGPEVGSIAFFAVADRKNRNGAGAGVFVEKDPPVADSQAILRAFIYLQLLYVARLGFCEPLDP